MALWAAVVPVVSNFVEENDTSYLTYDLHDNAHIKFAFVHTARSWLDGSAVTAGPGS